MITKKSVIEESRRSNLYMNSTPPLLTAPKQMKAPVGGS